MELAQQAQREAALPTEMPEQVKKPGWKRRDFKQYDKTTRRAMTAVEVMARNEQAVEALGRMVSLEDELPPPSTAPAVVEGSRKRPRKHTAVYREAFGDSQEDPTAGIKRGRAGGIL
jgi:hypothetical protein